MNPCIVKAAVLLYQPVWRTVMLLLSPPRLSADHQLSSVCVAGGGEALQTAVMGTVTDVRADLAASDLSLIQLCNTRETS